jgi:hypothetical protein
MCHFFVVSTVLLILVIKLSISERAFASKSVTDVSVESDRPVNSRATHSIVKILFLFHPTVLLRKPSAPSSEFILEFLPLPKSTEKMKQITYTSESERYGFTRFSFPTDMLVSILSSVLKQIDLHYILTNPGSS